MSNATTESLPGMIRIAVNEARSYSTKARLLRAIDSKGFGSFRFLPVLTEGGRWTAIFTYDGVDGFGSFVAGYGFPVIS